MQLRKRALVYPALMAAVALVLSVALLQLAQFGGQATARAEPLAQIGPSEFTLTVVKDAVPNSTQPFTFLVGAATSGVPVGAVSADALGAGQFEAAQDVPEGFFHFELIDDGTDISNTWTISGPTEVGLVIIYEFLTEGWMPTDVRCQDETGALVRGWQIDGVGAFILLDVEDGGDYTCTFTNGAPAIEFDKTVGTDPSVCASAGEIDVVEGTDVTYCYTVMNRGGLPLVVHGLEDDQFGPMLSALNYTLAPGASTFVTHTTTAAVTTTNVATWTAAVTYVSYISVSILGPILPITPGGPLSPSSQDLLPKYFHPFTAEATDAATVNAAPPAPSIAVTKTVGIDPGVCASLSSLTVPAGTTVYYCYTAANTGNIALPLHDLEDSELGSVFTGLDYMLAPGSSVNTVAAGETVSATIDVATTNVATWTAYVDDSVTAQSVTAVDSATVRLTPTDLDPDDQPPGGWRLHLPQIGK